MWLRDAADIMVQPAYSLDPQRRCVVLKALCGLCAYRQWLLHTAHVRSNHVHVVITASPRPERIMNDLKSYASKRLNQAGFDTKDRKRWTRHGSTRYLWNEERLAETIEYVLNGQGPPMEVFTPAE
jgi:REP element-mobilizing transposase RayT